MTSPETTVLRQRLVRVITRRAGATGVTSVAAAVRLTHDDLTAMLAPLISAAGVEALWGRAFDLVRRESPGVERRGDDRRSDEPFAEVIHWLETQGSSATVDAAAAMFATFAELLAALIGEPLTTRYLEKAWPDGFSDPEPKGKRT